MQIVHTADKSIVFPLTTRHPISLISTPHPAQRIFVVPTRATPAARRRVTVAAPKSLIAFPIALIRRINSTSSM